MTQVDAWQIGKIEEDEPQRLLGRGLGLLDRLADDPRPVLRWYRSTRPALVLGRGQGALALRSMENLEVITRFSGGGAVLMDEGLLSLDIFLPAGHALLAGDPLAVFDRVGQAWARALGSLGVPDLTIHDGAGTARRRGSPREQLLAAVCYATLGRGEVLAGGRKLVGLAQRRRRQGALVQCGLLRRWEPEPVLRALGAEIDDAEVLGHAVGLDDLLTSPPSDEAVQRAVEAELTSPGASQPSNG